MFRASVFSSFLILCFAFDAATQSDSMNGDLLSTFKYHVYYLSDDSLEGRGTATEGEKKASAYIAHQFKSIGLKPAGADGSYLAPFDFIDGRLIGENNKLIAGGKAFTLDKDYYPLAFSSNANISGQCVNAGYGIVAPDLKYDDYGKIKKATGKIFLINVSTPSGDSPHSKFGRYLDLRIRAEAAISKGAAGIIFYSTEDSIDNPAQMLDKNIHALSVPVVFMKNHAWDDIQEVNKLQAELSTELIIIEKTGNNVAGWIDNRAATTVVLGAHYDHLGFGGKSTGSLHRGESAIHNGADDNASGVAMITELARKLKSSELNNNNYVIVAFSGEELGLYGSKQFVNFMGDDIKKVNYMLNFDMVGRLDTADRKIEVNGYGTSPAWQVVMNIPTDRITIKTSASGIGPSDHTSFYLKDIPVLHFFTGAHQDYHKPSDDALLVNYDGMVSIFNLTYALVDSLNDDGRIKFTAVAADTSQSTPRFKVTLGIIPDYMFSDEGVRIDGVTEGKPASVAGLKTGDVVIRLGEYTIGDMMSYMKALSRFNKGDTTTVVVKRAEETLDFKITF